MVLTISFSLFIIYLIIISYLNKKIPETISETFYLQGKYLFTLLIWFLGFSIMISMIDVVSAHYLIFIISSGLLLIGASPLYKEGTERKIHISGFYIAVIALIMWAIQIKLWYIFIIAGIMDYIIYKYLCLKWVFILECSILCSGYIMMMLYKYTQCA